MKYIIIGNSAAAVGCIEGIRQKDRASEITVVSKEKYFTYSRPLISYLLEGKTDLERMKYRPDSFYSDNSVKLISGDECIAINHPGKQITLKSGLTLSYDKLLAATGSVPFVPPAEGLETVKNRFCFYTLDDALALQAAITENSRVLIMGAGLIGLKCAEGIYKKVQSITVIDLAERVLPSIIDSDGSALVAAELESKGINIITSDCAVKYEGNSVLLKSGKLLEFDILVTAVGVRANTALLAQCGADVCRGVKVNSKSETSLPDIYAAGDCTEYFDIASETEHTMALLPNAYRQGFCAGVNMAGGDERFEDAIPMNSLHLFDMYIMTAGAYIGECVEASDEKGLKKLFVKENLLKGYIIIGDIRAAGVYTSLITNKTPLDTIDFELVAQKPGLMAFSRNDRAELLKVK